MSGAGRRIRGLALVLGSLAVLVPLAALATDAVFGHDVTLMLGRHDAAEIQEWRRLRDPGDDPAEIYGQPQPGSPRRVLLVPWGPAVELVRLPEAPARRLLFVDEQPELHLIDARRVRTWALTAGVLLVLVALAIRLAPRARRDTVAA